MEIQTFQYNALIDWILRLEHEHQVEVHIGGVLNYTALEKLQTHFLSKLMIHENPYCIFCKGNRLLWNKCIADKARIMKKVAQQDSPYIGYCHCGVGELLAPVYRSKKVAGYVSIGCFRPDDKTLEKRFCAMTRQFGVDKATMQRIYFQSIPDRKEAAPSLWEAIGTLSLLLSALADGLLLDAEGTSANESQQKLLAQAVEYLHLRYDKGICVKDVARFCSCSVSHLQHLFQRRYHTSISAYLEELRMEKAGLLLLNSRKPISEIARMIGYRDPNYFTMVFAKNHGMPPTAYRRKNK